MVTNMFMTDLILTYTLSLYIATVIGFVVIFKGLFKR